VHPLQCVIQQRAWQPGKGAPHGDETTCFTAHPLTALIEGRLSTASAKDELVKLAIRLIVEEALEGEAADAVGREYYEHGARTEMDIARDG
jgi:hypothetical protein